MIPGDDEFGSRIRFSRLKLMAKSPAHYYANPQGESAAMDRGSAVHSAILGGKRVTFYDKMTASGRSAPRNGVDWERFKSANADALILSRSEYDETARIVESIRGHKDAMAILDGPGARKEETLLFDFMGRECRTTPDSFSAGLCVELKTCRSSDPRRFGLQSFWSYYHAQVAFHLEGIRRNKLHDIPHVPYIVAVECAPPYPVTIFRVTDRAIEQGMKSIRLWMEQVKSCESSNHWPAYSQSVCDLDVPEDDELVFPGGAENDNSTAPFMVE